MTVIVGGLGKTLRCYQGNLCAHSESVIDLHGDMILLTLLHAKKSNQKTNVTILNSSVWVPHAVPCVMPSWVAAHITHN